jgi:hypothetical protein
MKRIAIVLAALAAMITSFFAGPAVAQLTVRGYTDGQGKPLPTTGITMDMQTRGGETTLALRNLMIFGDAGEKNEPGKRLATYAANPERFKGGTVYALKLGADWRGGRNAGQVDLKAENGVAVLAQAPVGNNEVVLKFRGLKAAQGQPAACQPMNFLIVMPDGKRAWLGHAGWAASNEDAGIGDYMVLARNIGSYPATVACYDGQGNQLRLTPAMRAELAQIVQPPAGTKVPEQKRTDVSKDL